MWVAMYIKQNKLNKSIKHITEEVSIAFKFPCECRKSFFFKFNFMWHTVPYTRSIMTEGFGSLNSLNGINMQITELTSVIQMNVKIKFRVIWKICRQSIRHKFKHKIENNFSFFLNRELCGLALIDHKHIRTTIGPHNCTILKIWQD